MNDIFFVKLINSNGKELSKEHQERLISLGFERYKDGFLKNINELVNNLSVNNKKKVLL